MVLDLCTIPLYFQNIFFLQKMKYLAWSFTTSLNRNITIWWGFFRLLAPMCTGMAAGAVCLKKPHHIVILRFSEVVKGHANSFFYFSVIFELRIGFSHNSIYSMEWNSRRQFENCFCPLTLKVTKIFSLQISQKLRLSKLIPRQLSIFEGNDFCIIRSAVCLQNTFWPLAS